MLGKQVVEYFSHLRRRGASLVALGLLDLGVAWALWTLDDYAAIVRTNYSGQTAFLPLSVWAIVWLVVGVVDLIQAFARRDDRIAFVLSAGVKFCWAIGYVIGLTFYDLQRAWLSVILYSTLGVLVLIISGWQENRLDDDVARLRETMEGEGT
jgi:hypothetical protein